MPNDPTKLATKADLQEFYNRIRPYLGGSVNAGCTPVGTIITVAGTTPPLNYVVCNGQTLKIKEYKELATYFEDQYGAKNHFGGNGISTFAVPDLGGNPTDIIFCIAVRNIYQGAIGGVPIAMTENPTDNSVVKYNAASGLWTSGGYLSFSLEEQVVGTWINGETLYQRTFDCGALPNNAIKYISTDIVAGSVVVREIFGYARRPSDEHIWTLPAVHVNATTSQILINSNDSNGYRQITIQTGSDRTAWTESFVTLRYTKVSDN